MDFLYLLLFVVSIKKAIIKALSRLHGSYALGVICDECPQKLYVARESSPLILGVGVEENYFASDVTALVSYTRNVIYLDDGEFAEISPDSITVFDAAGHPISKKISHISWDIQSAEKGGYEHFMLKEIHEQPRVIRDTLAGRLVGGRLEIDELGLDNTDRRMMEAIISFYGGGPVGLDTLAATIGEEAITLEDVYEPYLVQNGFILRTSRGRILTPEAYLHFGRVPQEIK